MCQPKKHHKYEKQPQQSTWIHPIMLIEKYQKKYKELRRNVLVINSYYGAIHCSNCKKVEFYEYGVKMLIEEPEKQENFYLNCLKFYLADVLKDKWEKFGTEIGIFIMQSFEGRNKELKNTFRRFTNGKGNIIPQSLKRLWDLFYYK